jgi:hypothetical protein
MAETSRDHAHGMICSNPDFGFNHRIDNGEISFGQLLVRAYK